jgi:hypothetical protein
MKPFVPANGTQTIDAGGGAVKRLAIHVTGGFAGSCVLKARHESAAAGLAVSVPYTNRATGAAVAAATAITGDGIYEVDATGVVNDFVFSGIVTPGTWYVKPVVG